MDTSMTVLRQSGRRSQSRTSSKNINLRVVFCIRAYTPKTELTVLSHSLALFLEGRSMFSDSVALDAATIAVIALLWRGGKLHHAHHRLHSLTTMQLSFHGFGHGLFYSLRMNTSECRLTITYDLPSRHGSYSCTTLLYPLRKATNQRWETTTTFPREAHRATSCILSLADHRGIEQRPKPSGRQNTSFLWSIG